MRLVDRKHLVLVSDRLLAEHPLQDLARLALGMRHEVFNHLQLIVCHVRLRASLGHTALRFVQP